MKFNFIIEIHPAGVFGIPEGETLVLPAGTTGEIIGDIYHTKTFKKTGHGQLSKYRDSKDSITLKLSLPEVNCTFIDNFLHLTIEAENATVAYYNASLLLKNLLQHFALSYKLFFSYRVIVIQDENDNVYPVPESKTISSLRMYNLKHLKEELTKLKSYSGIKDEKLSKALQYYEHALFLLEGRDEATDSHLRHSRYVLSAVILNLWKAMTTITGDPANDRDHQSRYKQFNLTYNFYKSKIEDFTNFRNSCDIAHYEITNKHLKEIEESIGKYKAITEEVLTAYRNYLLSIK